MQWLNLRVFVCALFCTASSHSAPARRRRHRPALSRAPFASRAKMRHHDSACDLLPIQREELRPVCQVGIRAVRARARWDLIYAGKNARAVAILCARPVLSFHRCCRWGLLPECVVMVTAFASALNRNHRTAFFRARAALAAM